ncbi:MAG: DUF3570 domain-containing protein [Myxococcales bacterium]|nr:DUF3570 domain-containing protein [Myxococcales bacterium]MBL0195449.1 DUF3570 domain-containing protein [Myxococcales bacterium]
MRLSLTIPLSLALGGLAVAASPAASSAQTRAAGWVAVYGASDGLVVVSPQVSAKAEVRDTLEVQGGYEVDVISAASVDVMTAASPRGYTEVRQAVTAATTWRPKPEARLSARYVPSWEPDYQSHSVSASGSHEWLSGKLTTDVGLRVSSDEVGRTGASRDTWRPLHTGGIDAGIGWVFGPRTVGQLAYETQVSSGLQSSPYRFVRMYAPGSPAAASVPFGVTESVPSERVRHALGGALRHAITPRWFATTSLRFYADSWGIASHTEEVELQHMAFGQRLLTGLSARVYGQSAAAFYEPHYVSDGDLPRYRTADKMLVRSLTGLAGLRGSYLVRTLGALRDLRFTAKLELYTQRFFAFAPLALRHSIIGSFGIAGEL